jgi:hypothetical protein
MFIAVVSVMIAIAGCSKAVKTANEKWVYLFDGKSLDSWVQRGGKALYHIADGAIVGTTVKGTDNSFLCTEKMYSDFILELDFKIDPGANSGVQIRSNSFKDYKNGRVHGYQVEIDAGLEPYTRQPRNLLSNGQVSPDSEPRCWTGGIYDEARRGWLHDLTKNEPARRAFKSGRWNHFRIEAVADCFKTWLNDIPAADLKDSMTPTGFIALQVHSTNSDEPLRVWWRNIRMLNLDR